jgi:hypothetical protein
LGLEGESIVVSEEGGEEGIEVEDYESETPKVEAEERKIKVPVAMKWTIENKLPPKSPKTPVKIETDFQNNSPSAKTKSLELRLSGCQNTIKEL